MSTNGTVPATLITHLHKIQGQLKKLNSVAASGPLTFADIIDFPDPNNTQSRMDGELELQRMIYEYSYQNVQRRFSKRGLEILDQYDDIMASLETNNVPEDIEILTITRELLRKIEDLLKDEKPQGPNFIALIRTIDMMSKGWRKTLQAVEGENVLTRWDDLTGISGLTARIYNTIAHLLFFSC